MKTKTELQVIQKRSEKTYRIVLQHFEPATGTTGRYRDVCSMRLEADKNATPENMIQRFTNAIGTMTGKG